MIFQELLLQVVKRHEQFNGAQLIAKQKRIKPLGGECGFSPGFKHYIKKFSVEKTSAKISLVKIGTRRPDLVVCVTKGDACMHTYFLQWDVSFLTQGVLLYCIVWHSPL